MCVRFGALVWKVAGTHLAGLEDVLEGGGDIAGRFGGHVWEGLWEMFGTCSGCLWKMSGSVSISLHGFEDMFIRRSCLLLLPCVGSVAHYFLFRGGVFYAA